MNTNVVACARLSAFGLSAGDILLRQGSGGRVGLYSATTDSMRIYESKNFALHHESGSCRTNGHQYIYI
ncbi:MAG TPA: hypothetical protein VK562_01185 [Candidatus Acidoferrum sp.]|nr:hypothetical protein [Candidatus Acidoferrum sp.]